MDYEIGFSGHANIRSLHPRTIEITRETHLTPSGDCIIGVGAAAACADLPAGLAGLLRSADTAVTVTIRAGGCEYVVRGRGDPGLQLSHPGDIVIRRSGFVCPRTLAVGCDGASDSVPRGMVRALQEPGARGTFAISAERMPA